MTKIMLVEDDNNLREIYEARLLAEGYEIISAKDGEEALAMAVKEKPDLIISDIMMPKISGFDMLDILRSTPETKNTKVIMMTALSQAEDEARADKLGADRYLVKSQVTLEDVARVAKEVLNGEEAPVITAAPATVATAAVVADDQTDTKSTTPQPVEGTPVTDPPVSSPTDANTTQNPAKPVDEPVVIADSSGSTTIDPALAASLVEEEKAVDAQIDKFEAEPAPPSTEPEPIAVAPIEATKNESDSLDEPTADDVKVTNNNFEPQSISVKETPAESNDATGSAKEAEVAEAINDIVKEETPMQASDDNESSSDSNVPVAHKKVINPINDLSQKPPDLNELAAKERENEAVSPVVAYDSIPVESVIQPSGAIVTPATKDGDASMDQPGNVIIPEGGVAGGTSTTDEHPSDLAL